MFSSNAVYLVVLLLSLVAGFNLHRLRNARNKKLKAQEEQLNAMLEMMREKGKGDDADDEKENIDG